MRLIWRIVGSRVRTLTGKEIELDIEPSYPVSLSLAVEQNLLSGVWVTCPIEEIQSYPM